MHIELKKTHSSGELMSRVFVYCVFIFSLEYALYIVSGVLLDGLIKISSLALLMVFALKPSNRINRMEVNLLLFYVMLFVAAALPSILSGDITGSLVLVKYLYMAMILPVLLICYRSIPNCDDLLISTFIAIGVLFSVQAIVACIGVFFGFFDKSQVVQIPRYNDMDIVNFGVWGFGNAIQSPFSDFKILRPQGWFLEPSLLAAFLLLPAFVSIGRYKVYRLKRYFISAFLNFFAILLTLSLAGYLGVVCAVLLVSCSKFCYRHLKKIRVLKYSYVLPIFLVFFGLAFGLLNLLYVVNDIDSNSVSDGQAAMTNLMGRDKDGTSGNLFRETYKSDNYIDVLMNSPFGLGFGSEAKSGKYKSGNALLFWFTAGGIPAVLIIMMMFTYIFLVFCHPLLISGNPIFNGLGASFVGHAIQNLSYGTWIAPYFLIHLGLVVMSARKVNPKFIENRFI